jgi:hypothetical protein
LKKTKPRTTLVQYKEEKMISKPKELRENKTLSEKQQTQHENKYKQRTHNTEACNRVSVFLFWALWFQNLWNEEEPKPQKKQTNKQTLEHEEEEEEESFNLADSTLPHKHEHHKTKLKSRTKRK